MQKFDVRRQVKQELEEISTHQLRGFNNNITTTSFHHSSDNSTILKKIFDARIFLKKEQTCRTLLPGQAKRLHITANLLQCVTPG